MKRKVHIIAPYESMQIIIKECIPLFPEMDIQYSVGDLQVGAQLAIEVEKEGVDAIISRGGTAKLIRKAVKVPVFDMHLSGYDMIRTLTLASSLTDKTAIVGFSNITSGAQSVIELLELPLQVYTVQNSEEVAPLIAQLKKEGYVQIVGDAITMKTSKALGINGLLIQSGREAMISALSETKLLLGYMEKKDLLQQLMEKLMAKQNQNLFIVNDKSEIIYEYFVDFSENPLCIEDLYFIQTEIITNKETMTRAIKKDEKVLYITGDIFQFGEDRYIVYTIVEDHLKVFPLKGPVKKVTAESQPIAASSLTIQTLVNNARILYEKNDPIVLQGSKGSGKNFLADYIHGELGNHGLLLTLNIKEFDSYRLESLPLTNVSTIKIIVSSNLELNEDFQKFMKECHKEGIRIFLLTYQGMDEQIIKDLHLNVLILPNLSERMEDIEPLVLYFLAYYHQSYGTVPVKIKKEALQILEECVYPNNLEDLKHMVKQLALNEKGYVVQPETVEKVLFDSPIINENWQSPKGTLKDIEKQIIKAVLKEENNNQTKTAERLGINRATLWRKLKE